MAFISKTNISTSNLIEASHITNIIDALDGTTATQINMTGAVTASNARITGSFKGNIVGNVTGDVTGNATGLLNGTFSAALDGGTFKINSAVEDLETRIIQHSSGLYTDFGEFEVFTNGPIRAAAFTGSLQGTATTASFVNTARTASFVATAQTASYISPTFISASAAASGFGSGGGSTSPGGSEGHVQYNNGIGGFAGESVLAISSSLIVMNSAAAYNYATFNINSSIAGGESYGTRNVIDVIGGTVYDFPAGKFLQVITGNIMQFEPMAGGASAQPGDVIQYSPGAGGWVSITDASDTALADGSIGLVVEGAGGGANIKVLFDGLVVVKNVGAYWGGFTGGAPPSWTIYPRNAPGSGTQLGRNRPSTTGYILRALGTILANNADTAGARWLTVQWRPELKGTEI